MFSETPLKRVRPVLGISKASTSVPFKFHAVVSEYFHALLVACFINDDCSQCLVLLGDFSILSSLFRFRSFSKTFIEMFSMKNAH